MLLHSKWQRCVDQRANLELYSAEMTSWLQTNVLNFDQASLSTLLRGSMILYYITAQTPAPTPSINRRVWQPFALWCVSVLVVAVPEEAQRVKCCQTLVLIEGVRAGV